MIHLQNNQFQMDISRVGAEIHHLLDPNGVERIWQNVPAVWPSHTPLLFPIAGALKDDTWYYQGRAYTMPKHGFVRTKEFELESVDMTHATLVLRGEAIRNAGYPFECELRVCYTLTGNQVLIEYKTRNVGKEPLYYSIGSHEGYACEGGIEQFEVIFPEDESLEQTLLNGSLLRHETRVWPLQDHALTLTADDFKDDALVFASLKSREVTLRRRDRAYEVSVSFPQCDTLLLWTKVGAPYLCIEPWCNAPDYVDCDQQLVHKPGMIRVEPGQEHTVAHTLTFR